MKRIIMFLLLFAALKVAGQTTGYLRFDTVKIMKQNGTCELYVINKTKDSLGLLTNVGGGLTRFIKPKVLNDSVVIIGLDTLTIKGGAGGGGSNPTAGYGIGVTGSQVRVDTNVIDLRYYNVINVKDFGAVGDSLTNDGPAIQAAINYAFTHHKDVYFPYGHYRVATAVQATVDGRACNCQLYIPYSPIDSARTMRFIAANPVDFEVQGIANFAVSKQGVIIESSLTGQADSTFILGAVKGPGSGTFDKFSQTTPIIEGIGFRVRADAGAQGLGGLDFRYTSKVVLDQVKVDINTSIFDSPDPTGTGSIGILLPERGNHAQLSIGTIRIVGFDVGMTIQEHMVAKDLQVAGCNIATWLGDGDHSASIQTFEAELNKTNMYHNGQMQLWVSNFNSEHYTNGDKWYEFENDIEFNNSNVGEFTRINIGNYWSGDSFTGDYSVIPITTHPQLVGVLGTRFQMNKREDYMSTMLGELNDLPGRGVFQITNMPGGTDAKRFMMYNTTNVSGSFFNDAGDTEAPVFSYIRDGMNPASHRYAASTFNISSSVSDAGTKRFNVFGGAAINAGLTLNGTSTGGSDVNVINLGTDGDAMAFLGGSGTSLSSATGPFLGFRGNTYSAIGSQRGAMFIGAGNPSTPTGIEGSIILYTGATLPRMNISAAGEITFNTSTNSYTFPTTRASAGQVLTDVSGSGALTWATPSGGQTLEQVLTTGSTLTGIHTWAAGNFSQTLTSTQASAAGWNFQNTGNGEAVSITTNGTGSALSTANSSSGPGLSVSSNSGHGVNVNSTSGTLFRGIVNPSSTNTEVVTFRPIRQTSSTAAAGMGQIWSADLEDDGGNSISAVLHKTIWTSAAAGATSADYQLWTIGSGTSAKRFTVKGNGQIEHNNYGSGTFTVTPATTPVYSSSGVVGERIAPKIYTALLTQSATGAPTATVLGTNEIGSIVWTRNSAGNYTGTLSGAFTANKTWLIVQQGDQTGSFIRSILSWTSANALLLTTTDNTGTPTDGYTNMSVEIRVYP